jgi:hopanoid biosynthesis associated radical SAM protein HpnH
MGFPPQQMLRLSHYLLSKKLSQEKRYPLVLMLELTYRCNLSCAGCGRIREYRDALSQALSVEQCLASAAEADAPVVAVSGGEPLLHAGVQEIVAGLIEQKRFVYLCTNGLLMQKSLAKFSPSPYFSFNVHLDGLAETHDRLVGRRGTFDTAVEAIGAAKRAGYRVCTNTTVYKGTDPNEIKQLLSLLMDQGVDGVLLSPAFGYEAVAEDIFLTRNEIQGLFRTILSHPNGIRFYNTPPYLELLKGERELECTPWGNPTRTPQGWKQPCYLLTDGYCSSFRELMETTDWERYGLGRDPRCANCMVHSGFEASAVLSMGRPAGLAKAISWSLSS